MSFSYKILLWMGLSCTIMACAQHKKKSALRLMHYDITTAQSVILPRYLKEISGITWLTKDSMNIYGEQDELGIVYKINVNDGSAFPFIDLKKKGDFEDITYRKGDFYLLESNGRIYRFAADTFNSNQNIEIIKGLLPKSEYEGLCFAEKENALYALTKYKSKDNKGIFIYKIPLLEDGSVRAKPLLITISNKTIEKTLKLKGIEFHPSAMSFNEEDKQWYILSSVNHLILVMDKDWTPIDYAILKMSKFPQPEGLSFDRNGNLWISSEGRHLPYGLLYKIERTAE